MLLAIDTATHTASLGLYDVGGLLAETSWRTRENHTRSLMPELTRLLARVAASADAIGAIGVTTGPGSFTGLRIGLSVAKGLAYSLEAALVGVPTLDVAAAPYAFQSQYVCALIQAGRGRYGAGLYETDNRAARRVGEYWFGGPQDIVAGLEGRLPNSLSPVLVTGEMDAPLAEALQERMASLARLAPPGMHVRRAGWLAVLAWERWHAGNIDDLEILAPYYIPTASL